MSSAFEKKIPVRPRGGIARANGDRARAGGAWYRRVDGRAQAGGSGGRFERGASSEAQWARGCEARWAGNNARGAVGNIGLTTSLHLAGEAIALSALQILRVGCRQAVPRA